MIHSAIYEQIYYQIFEFLYELEFVYKILLSENCNKQDAYGIFRLVWLIIYQCNAQHMHTYIPAGAIATAAQALN